LQTSASLETAVFSEIVKKTLDFINLFIGYTDLKFKTHGKYIDPSLPGIAYQMAHGARSVWAPVFDTRPKLDPMKTTAGMPAIHPSRWRLPNG